MTEEDDKTAAFNNSNRWIGPDDDGEIKETIGKFGGWNSPLSSNGDPSQLAGTARIANPAQAFDDLAKQPGDESRQNVLHEIASQWAEQDPKAAMAKLQETTDPWLKLGLINALSNRARQTHDPLLAGEIAKAYPETSWQSKTIVREVYASMAKHDPARAQAMLKSDLDTGVKTSIASALATQQANYDPAGAVTWATQQTDEKVQSGAMTAAVSSWAGADAYAASEWLATQPAGPLREAAVHGLVQSLRQNSPDDALQWAGTLTDPQQRDDEQFSILANMINQDLAKAKELAKGSQLSKTKRNMLDQFIQNVEKAGH